MKTIKKTCFPYFPPLFFNLTPQKGIAFFRSERGGGRQAGHFSHDRVLYEVFCQVVKRRAMAGYTRFLNKNLLSLCRASLAEKTN